MKKFAIALSLAACLALSATAADIPRKAPENLLVLPPGKAAKLADYKGKVVIVAYILTT
jgi:hypothetical protein